MAGDEANLPQCGVLTSPKYPSYYPRNHDSTHVIRVAEGNTIRIVWTHFDTELDTDEVMVQDENGTTLMPYADHLDRFHPGISGRKLVPRPWWGGHLPPPAVSNSSIVVVRFELN